jgi:hypothetical protein
MTSDTSGGEPRGIPLRAMCPQCHNPHTIVAEQRYRGMLRFCPMCDHSWVVGQVTREKDAQSKGRQDAGPKKSEKLAAKR